MREFGADSGCSTLSFYFGMTRDCGRKIATAKVYGGRAAAVPVVDRLSSARVDVNAKDRHLIVLPRVLVHLLGRGVLTSGRRLGRVRSIGIHWGRGIAQSEHRGPKT